MKNIILVSITLITFSCHFLGKSSTATNCNTSKFDFDIDAINEKGEYLELNNSSFLNYMFCVDQNSECIDEIMRINPKLKPLKYSALLKCGKQNILMSGDTSEDPNAKQTLCMLAELSCVKSINKTPYE